MTKGTVKWFNSNKGYGFITPENGSKDVFVHITALEKSGLHEVNEGQKISYEVESNKGKLFLTYKIAGRMEEKLWKIFYIWRKKAARKI